jgi:hypothetical protein
VYFRRISKKLKAFCPFLKDKMFNNFLRWFRNLSRPTVSTVQVILYENHREKEFSAFHLSKQEILMKEIQSLWQAPPNAPYWFEPELHEVCSCWKKHPPKLFVVCYQEKELDPTKKREADIPNRYRTKMFNRYHKLAVKEGTHFWPHPIEVKFILVQ